MDPKGAMDPVLVLLGGPGESAAGRVRAIAAAHAAINERRDVVLVDQRGTGRSAPLGCAYGDDVDLQEYMDFLPLARMRECVAAMAARADISAYGTADFVADLEELRAALRADAWNLHAGSYGTRVALLYLERYPRAIRSAILIAVAPPEATMPASFGADADRALRMLMDDCRRNSECNAAFPGLAAEIDSIAGRLERGPALVEVPHLVTGQPVRVRFTRAAFGEAVRAALYSPASARRLPLDLHHAYRGDYSALTVAHLRRQRTIAREGWSGLYLAVTCAEDVPRASASRVYSESRGTILGEHRARQHFAACALLSPPGAPRRAWSATGRIVSPVLMIVGDQDPATPPRWARLIRGRMARASLVIVPQGGHGFGGMRGTGCLERLQLAFLDDPGGSLDTACARNMERLPFLLR